MSELEARFQLEMVGIYERAKKECNYNATRFLQMVTDSGGLGAAKALLRAPDVSDGFTHLVGARPTRPDYRSSGRARPVENPVHRPGACCRTKEAQRPRI